MLLSFREEGATEESSASAEDLEFQVHKNVSEGAEHFYCFCLGKLHFIAL